MRSNKLLWIAWSPKSKWTAENEPDQDFFSEKPNITNAKEYCDQVRENWQLHTIRRPGEGFGVYWMS